MIYIIYKHCRQILYHMSHKGNPRILEWVAYPLGFPGGSEIKASACNAGDLGSIPGLGRFPGEGNGNPLQYSCLENPIDGGAWLATVHGLQRVRHNWVTSFSLSLSPSLQLSAYALVYLCFTLVVQSQNWWCQREIMMLNHQGRRIFSRSLTLSQVPSICSHLTLMWAWWGTMIPIFQMRKIDSERLKKLPNHQTSQPHQFA